MTPRERWRRYCRLKRMVLGYQAIQAEHGNRRPALDALLIAKPEIPSGRPQRPVTWPKTNTITSCRVRWLYRLHRYAGYRIPAAKAKLQAAGL